MYIYLVENLVNDKVYIGKTKNDVEKRLDQHIKLSCKKPDTHFYRAIQKHGKENFLISLIEEVKENDANNKESYWIKHYREKLGNRNVYNGTNGGDGGDTYTFNLNREKVILSCSEAQKKRFSRQSERMLASKRSKKMWKNPDYQEKIKRCRLKRWANISKEEMKKHSENSKRIWKKKAFRESHKKSMIEFWKNNKEEMKQKLKLSNTRNKEAIDKWNKIIGENFSQDLRSMIKSGAGTKQILDKYSISMGQLTSILKTYFGVRTKNQVI